MDMEFIEACDECRPDEGYSDFVRKVNMGKLCKALKQNGFSQEELEKAADESGTIFVPGTKSAKIAKIATNGFIFLVGAGLTYAATLFFDAMIEPFQYELYPSVKYGLSVLLPAYFVTYHNSPKPSDYGDGFVTSEDPPTGEYKMFNWLKGRHPEKVQEALKKISID